MKDYKSGNNGTVILDESLLSAMEEFEEIYGDSDDSIKDSVETVSEEPVFPANPLGQSLQKM